MKLIADSGATKTDWAIVLPGQSSNYTVQNTIGFNPYFIDQAGIVADITNNLLPKLTSTNLVEEVYFYGAGCSSADKQQIVLQALKEVFVNATTIIVSHDLLGSARALLGKNSGFAAILGTGTNTCIYDGHDCVLNIDSLGYLLGDEGSGAYIGKKLLAAYLRNQFDDLLKSDFEKEFGAITTSERITTLYNQQFPNRWLAAHARFAGKHHQHPFIKQLVSTCFTDFFEQLVSKYPNYKQYQFNCVGSIAAHFSEELTAVANTYHMQVGKIIASPIQQLAAYHATV
jgi:N-acetylglucosamine kinase-like BadF-type ATPase